MKKLFNVALCALAAVAFMSCTKTESSIKKVESIRIYEVNDQGELTKDVTGTLITINSDYTKKWYAVKFTPADATDHTFTVESGSTSVVIPVVEAAIENKFSVTIAGNGQDIVTATTTDGNKTASFSIHVSGM